MRRQSEEREIPPPGSTLGQRLGRFVALLGVTFVITATTVVTRRLSQDSLALLIGLSCGVMAMLPTIALGFMVWRREEVHRRSDTQHEMLQRQQGYGAPPVIVVAPQAMPGDYRAAFGAPNPSGSWMPQHSQRTFTIVGDEE
jgi:hypothetical protein